MPTFVIVDASVSLKWVLDDEDSVVPSIALRDDAHRGQVQMLAPSLWLYEVTNALVVARLRGRIDNRQSHLALRLLRKVGVRLVDPEPQDCLETAAELGISGYDAAYVALATAVEANLWTGDRRLWNKAGGKNETVRWIGDYESLE
jgi:predicted nucleic acid-binding protein